MKLDVLVLTHNRLDVTRRFVEALYSNTPDFHLWVLENGSTDGTPEYLKQLFGEKKNVTIEFRDTNLGVINGRNRLWDLWNMSPHEVETAEANVKFHGFNYESADHLVFLDNDQIVQEGWVDSYQKVFDRGYDIVGWEAWLQQPYGPKKFMPIRKCQPTTPFFSYVGCGGMMMQWEVFPKVGYFDRAFSPAYFEDPDFCYRAIDEGYKIGWNPTDKIVHEAHSTLGKTDWKKTFAASYQMFCKKWGNRFVPEIPHEPD